MVMTAEEAIKQFNVKLNKQLPLDDEIFCAMLKEADLFPLNAYDEIHAMSTRAKKVAYFLQHVIEPGAEQYLPKLLKVMKDCKVDNVVILAEEIEAAIGLGINIHTCSITIEIHTIYMYIYINFEATKFAKFHISFNLLKFHTFSFENILPSPTVF